MYIDIFDDHLLPFLDSNWGLQVSFCTGIARRVALRTVIADVMPALIESRWPVPRYWQSIKDRDIIGAFHSGSLHEWMAQLPNELQASVIHIVRYIINILQYTGVDKNGKNFVIAWIQKDKPLQCFKIPCKDESHWVLMLADSEDCATFAYVTSTCLETENIKCQGSVTTWSNTSSLLETAVSRYKTGCKPTSTTLSPLTPWTLKHSELYCLGRNPQLWAKVQRVSDNEVARLCMSRSTIPPSLLARLHLKKMEGQRLRERPSSDARAEEVIVLAGKSSM